MADSSPRLIVGLGNPGKDYEYTRHNLGFLAVREFAREHQFELKRSFFIKGLVAQGQFEGKKIFLLLPLTYMNNSGVAVKAMVRRKNIASENILVVCDDINLDFGDLRIRPNGSDGGHNGLNSLISHLHTEEFARLRLGVGQPGEKENVVDYVLSPFDGTEKKGLNGFLKEAMGCCRTWLIQGTAEAMNQFNKRKKMNKYEIMIIVNGQLTQEEKEAISKQAADAVTKNEGKVVSNQMWLEKHKFTFTIKKCSEGTYYLIKFEAPGSSIDKIRQAARLNEKILRFIITKVESH